MREVGGTSRWHCLVGTEELKLEKQVRSGDKELEVIHVEVIVEAERVDEVTMEV